MELSQEQYERIQHLLPVQRGNVKLDHLTFLRAMQYMAEKGFIPSAECARRMLLCDSVGMSLFRA